MVHLIPCRYDMTAEQMADLFVDEIVRLHGIGLEYRSDMDKIFRSAFCDRVWKRLGTTLAMSTAYHHESAGQAERTVQELRKFFQIYTKDHKTLTRWAEDISTAEFQMNSARNSSTGCTPFELNYGFNPRDPSAIPQVQIQSDPEVSRFVQQAQKSGDAWLSNLSEKIEKAKSSMLEAHAKMKE